MKNSGTLRSIKLLGIVQHTGAQAGGEFRICVACFDANFKPFFKIPSDQCLWHCFGSLSKQLFCINSQATCLF